MNVLGGILVVALVLGLLVGFWIVLIACGLPWWSVAVLPFLFIRGAKSRLASGRC